MIEEYAGNYSYESPNMVYLDIWMGCGKCEGYPISKANLPPGAFKAGVEV